MTTHADGFTRARPRPAIWRRAASREAAVWLALCAAWIWAMSLGDSNGFGYFHQPRNDLVAPLVAGGLINAALFWANAFCLIPRYLAAGRWRRYLVLILALCAANAALQTIAQKLIIWLNEPELAGLGWPALLLENSYLPPFVVILSSLYRFARDWAIHLHERRALHARAANLERMLLDTHAEVHSLKQTANNCGFLQLRSGTSKIQIPVDAIWYVKSAGNYLDIVTPAHSHMAYGALKDIIHELPKGRFVRIHRSYLVALDHIRTIRGDSVFLENAELPIGGVYKRAFLQEWQRRTTTNHRQKSH